MGKIQFIKSKVPLIKEVSAEDTSNKFENERSLRLLPAWSVEPRLEFNTSHKNIPVIYVTGPYKKKWDNSGLYFPPKWVFSSDGEGFSRYGQVGYP